MRLNRAILACGLLLSLPAAARDAFEGNVTVNGQSRDVSFDAAEDLVNIFSNAGLRDLFPTYTDTSAATAQLSLRGVQGMASYQQNSTTLRLVIPSAGIDESFTGATRNESQDQALDYLKGRGNSSLTRLLQTAVATTPIDPVAGNPTSLQSQMGASDFNIATGGAAQSGGFGLGARFGSFSANGYDTQTYTLPLGYSWNLANGYQIILDAPLTLLSTSDSQSYSGSLGFGVRFPIIRSEQISWSLTPMVRAGAVGSVDLGAVGSIWSASITSSLEWRIRPETTLTLGNMVAHLQTFPLKIDDYDISYELSNQMFRNGVILSQSIGEWFGRPMRASGFIIDTRFSGDALYVKSYQEYGGFLSFDAEVGRSRLPINLGFTLLNGERGYRGFSLNLGMTL